MPSLLEATDKKYGEEETLTVDCELPIAMYWPKKSPRKLLPSLLVLDDCNIESAGNEQELKKKCQSVEELDLAYNKLSRWREVFGILRHMPMVKFVNLSFNNLKEGLSNSESHSLPHLKNLVLNGTQIEWGSIRNILQLVPSLEELHLCLNNYKHIELNEEAEQCTTLKTLYLTGNPLSAWCEVSKLDRAFPYLEALVLAKCPLRSLELPAAPGSFRHLRFLNLNGTRLSAWGDVDRLRRFPALLSLRIQRCPLFDTPHQYTSQERRQLLIARLPNIQTLNGGGVIGVEERAEAERAFIRHYMDKDEADQPPRLHELLDTGGK